MTKLTLNIDKFDHGVGRRPQKLILGCEMGGMYHGTKKKLKREDNNGLRKCECSFKLCGYLMKSNEW